MTRKTKSAKADKAARPTIWDGRHDRLKDMRYTILPGDVADDLELSTLHLRFLTHVGRQNAKRGWCRISQAELAEKWTCSRSRLNQAIKLLVRKGYLRELLSPQTHECWCAYKVVIDDEEDVFRGGNTSSDADEGSVPRGEQECAAQGAGVSPQRNTYTDKTDKTDQKERGRADAQPAPADDDVRVVEAEIIEPSCRPKSTPQTGKSSAAKTGPRGHRLPDDWTPGDDGWNYALTLGLTERQVQSEFEKFCDYWRDQPGSKGVKLNWLGTWRNWVRRAAEDAKRPTVRKSGRFSVTDHLSN